MNRLLNYLSPSEERINNKDFKRIKEIGKGAFGRVLLACKQGGPDDGQMYAMKMIKKTSRSLERKSCARVERAVLEDVKGVPFLGQMHYAFHTRTNLYLVMEYMNGGDLFKYTTKLSVEEVRFYIGEVILALENLHKMGIAHRDVKPTNVMIDQDGHVVLIDFGCSWKFDKDDENKTICSGQKIGSIFYMAPEIVKLEPHGFPVDWWSVGIMVHYLLTMKYPFFGNREELADKIVDSRPSIDPELSAPAARFIEELLHKDQTRRLGSRGGDARELKAHKFFDGMDWNLLANKGYPPPRKPTIVHELDTTNFRNVTDLERADQASKEPFIDKIIYMNYPYPK